MKPSFEPLVLKSHPSVGEAHPNSPEMRAVQVRLFENSDIEGKVIYAGPKNWQVTESFVLRTAA
ncbi:hypothetical protein [Prosthecobacter sp.]|uniref:hypothetical protein n=1 Tax=Prosthecobacter sp. TaxID=1965333 RepID=UPI0037831B41